MKWDLLVSPAAVGASEVDSPNRDKKLFFFGLGSSCRPTSSNVSSSAIAFGLSNVLPFTDDLGSLKARESSEPRDGKLSPGKTGDLPEMSNDRRYDSNDSREMEKGSFSDSRLRWLEEVVDVEGLCQKLFFSVGDGGR